MPATKDRRGFSLIEVVVAVGLVAGALVAVLGLLASLARQSDEAGDLLRAARLPEAVAVELQALVTQRGLGAVASSVALNGRDGQTLRLVAARDGTQVREWREGESPEREQFFLIELRRFPSGPLAFAPEAPVLPLQAEVSWPLRVPGPEGAGTVVPADQRRRLEFSLAVRP